MSPPIPGMRRVEGSDVLIRSEPVVGPGMLVGNGFPTDGRMQLQRLMAAQEVLARLEHGWVPGEAELDDAPILSDWAYGLMPDGLSLLGRVTEHPRLPGDRKIVTSPVIAIDLGQLGWARTISRWYRLGRPLGTELQS